MYAESVILKNFKKDLKKVSRRWGKNQEHQPELAYSLDLPTALTCLMVWTCLRPKGDGRDCATMQPHATMLLGRVESPFLFRD